jgi:hypothetical protein
MKSTGLALFLTLALAAPSRADDVQAPVHARFADSGTREAPDFQRHVVPLLGRLGCNGRACHGSFQGQGGFRLSLFGYDFAKDHHALTQGVGSTGGRRVNQSKPTTSLVLAKPLRELPHRGGQRFKQGSWEHHLLFRWIESGSRGVGEPARLVGLDVTPQEIVLEKPGAVQPLRVVARWDDGTSEDVTCLCRYQTNDDSVAEVDGEGKVKAVGKGDTHVIVFYDNGVTSVPILLPFTGRTGDRYPAVSAPTRIDQLVVARLKKLGVVPSERCSDEEFLRRVSLDLTGTLPTPGEVEKFLADTLADKRAHKIDELLDSPAYAAWWANYFCDITGNSRFRQSEGRIGQQLAVQWYSWLYRRLRDNVPYDRIVEGMLVATGRRAGESYDDYAMQMSAYFRDGAPADFSLRETMPYFWSRENVGKPEEKALSFAHSFLGLRLQCAECHKHPFDRWTQNDFKQLASLFAGVTYGVAPSSQDAYGRLARATGTAARGNQGAPITPELLALAQEGKTIPWRELYVDAGKVPVGRPVALLGSTVHLKRGEDPRAAVMQWLRRRDNPYFARALVNRIWANYFHCGLIDPGDDLNLANPPSNGELLDYLTEDFVTSGCDLKRLHRQITGSLTYQRSWKPNETNENDRRNFSRFIPRRMPAEVLYDALKQATVADDQLRAVRHDLDRRAIGHLSTGLTGTYAMRIFGKPDRLLDCDCERSNKPTLLQGIFLQNDPLIHLRLQESGWLKELAQQNSEGKLDVEAAVRQAYLRTLSRPPSADEVTRARTHITEAGTAVEGIEDLLWALLNSKEFVLNH